MPILGSGSGGPWTRCDRISEDRKSGIITVGVTDGDRLRAAAIAQAYVEELDRLVPELSTSSAHRERVSLQERLTAVKQELELASKEFSQFASKNVTIDIKEQGKAMVDAAATLMRELVAAESELKGLEQIYTPNNVSVRSVQARISELRKQLKKMGGKEGTETNNSAAGGDPLYPSIRKFPLLRVTYADLYRRTRIQEAVYETLTQEYALTKVQEAKETPQRQSARCGAHPRKEILSAATADHVFLYVVGPGGDRRIGLRQSALEASGRAGSFPDHECAHAVGDA